MKRPPNQITSQVRYLHCPLRPSHHHSTAPLSQAKCSHQLAELKASCGKAQVARILYRNAVQSYTNVYSSIHATTASCMLSLAALSHRVREHGEALDLYRTVLELFVELYGPHHPSTTRVSNLLGDLEEEMEEEAGTKDQEAVEVEVEVEVAPGETLRRGCCHRSLRGDCLYLRRGGVDEADNEDEEEGEDGEEEGGEGEGEEGRGKIGMGAGLNRLGTLGDAAWRGTRMYGKAVFG
ncbi:hypothetical protein Vafri_14041 [Volvox africanus]|uniref:Uncharacterized protein n=1 Tax=Volvox africanus TaxID=51714 RepID=A0A8J4BHV8_9CHLO|nr:hypothetical protein Vafri_14041 [Volvox africanus]